MSPLPCAQPSTYTGLAQTYLAVGLAVYIAADNKPPKLADRQLLKQKYIIFLSINLIFYQFHLLEHVKIEHCII